MCITVAAGQFICFVQIFAMNPLQFCFTFFLLCSAPSLVFAQLSLAMRITAKTISSKQKSTGAAHKCTCELNVGTAVVYSADFFIVNFLHTCSSKLYSEKRKRCFERSCIYRINSKVTKNALNCTRSTIAIQFLHMRYILQA